MTTMSRQVPAMSTCPGSPLINALVLTIDITTMSYPVTQDYITYQYHSNDMNNLVVDHKNVKI